jgi:hypothetical protein
MKQKPDAETITLPEVAVIAAWRVRERRRRQEPAISPHCSQGPAPFLLEAPHYVASCAEVGDFAFATVMICRPYALRSFAVAPITPEASS